MDNAENMSLSEEKHILDDIPIPDSVDVKVEDAPTIEKDVMDMNGAFNLSRRMYENVLAPQLEENESIKRFHKSVLLENLFKILKAQFAMTYFFVLVLIVSIIFSGDINISDGVMLKLNVSDQVVTQLIKFIEFYITSIVVELISILYFIVKNVFDTSIVDLLKGFDKRKEDKDTWVPANMQVLFCFCHS